MIKALVLFVVIGVTVSSAGLASTFIAVVKPSDTIYALTIDGDLYGVDPRNCHVIVFCHIPASMGTRFVDLWYSGTGCAAITEGGDVWVAPEPACDWSLACNLGGVVSIAPSTWGQIKARTAP